MVPNMGKTIARLERGQDYPVLGAMRGWGTMGRSHLVLDGLQWTTEVFRICGVLDYHLPSHTLDQGHTGAYFATHAEKQLIAYFISKHTFLPYESYGPQLGELFKIRPNGLLRTATILISNKEICSDCRNFKEKVRQLLGIEFTIKSVTMTT